MRKGIIVLIGAYIFGVVYQLSSPYVATPMLLVGAVIFLFGIRWIALKWGK